MPSGNEIEALKARWTSEAVAAADRALAPMDAVAAYQGKVPSAPLVSPFGLYAGYIDFRYLPIGVIPANRRLEMLDFSGATAERRGQLHECTMIDCKLDGANMETNLGRHLERCSLVAARFSHSILRGTFIDCDFTRADLTRSLGSELKFIRCTFKDAKLAAVRFQYSSFENCVWVGTRFGAAGLAKVRFVGTAPTHEQLEQAMTPGMTFVPP